MAVLCMLFGRVPTALTNFSDTLNTFPTLSFRAEDCAPPKGQDLQGESSLGTYCRVGINWGLFLRRRYELLIHVDVPHHINGSSATSLGNALDRRLFARPSRLLLGRRCCEHSSGRRERPNTLSDASRQFISAGDPGRAKRARVEQLNRTASRTCRGRRERHRSGRHKTREEPRGINRGDIEKGIG